MAIRKLRTANSVSSCGVFWARPLERSLVNPNLQLMTRQKKRLAELR